MKPHTRYGFIVLGSAVFASVSWVLTEVAIRFFGVTPLLVVIIGNSVGGTVLLLISGKKLTNLQQSWQRRDWIRAGAAAISIYTLGFSLSFNAISLVGSGTSALLGQLQTPFIVGLAIIFLGEQLSLRRWLAGIITLGGAFVINFDFQLVQLNLGLGETLAILSPLGIATGIILLKPLVDKADAIAVTGLALLLGAIFLLPFIPFYGSTSGLGWAALLVIAAMGIVRGSSWLAYNTALRHLGASRCSIIFITFAFFTVLLQLAVSTTVPVLGLQLPTNLSSALLGGGLVASGIVILQTEAV